MWSNVISIDKCFSKEIEYILSKVKNIRDLSYAVEESRDRIWVYLASLCEKSARLEEEIALILQNVILTYMKTNFFLERMPSFTLNHATCSLVCSLVHFDRRYEENILRRRISETADFNVDGLYNFRLQELKQNWEEVIALASNLMISTDGDAYDIASFITSTDSAGNRVAIDSGEVYNLTTGRKADLLNIFDDEEYNLIMAVIGECPDEIVVERCRFSKAMTDTLRHIGDMVLQN